MERIQGSQSNEPTEGALVYTANRDGPSYCWTRANPSAAPKNGGFNIRSVKADVSFTEEMNE